MAGIGEMTMMIRHRFFAEFVCALVFVTGVATPFSSSAATAVAEARPREARPNQPIAYSIVIDGGNFDEMPMPRLPPQLVLNSSASQSQEITIVNGRQSMRSRLTWTITAGEPGEFVIPPQEVLVDGQTLRTNDVKLIVKESAQPEQQGVDPLLQISVDKTEFYQGEVVPIKASLYIHRSTNLRRIGLVEVSKDDFAIQRFPQQSEQSLEMIGDQPYYVLTFRSSLTALKTGKLKVGPATMEILLDMPLQMSPGFPQSFFQQMGEPRKVTVRSPDIAVTVLPLPSENQPANFSGAVGDFTMTANASPATLAVGDPITVEVSITGVGNFDALVAPTMTDTKGWKTYPARRYITSGVPDASQSASMERQIGFTQVIVPEKPLQVVPPFELSFFSPTEKQYVTQRTQPIAIVVNPGKIAAEPAAGPATASSASTASTAPPQADITDILVHVPPQPAFITAAPVPLFQRPVFWIANSVPVAACLGLLAFAFQKRRQEALASSPDAALRSLWQHLHEPSLSEGEFYRRAAQFIQAAGGRPPSEAIQAILDRYQALNFSGSETEARPVFREQHRADVLTALAPLLARAKTAGGVGVVRAILLIGAMSLLTAQPAKAGELQDRYREIVTAMDKADYGRAYNLAEALARELNSAGMLSPDLFEIMGHLSYRLGDHGHAVLWYKRAELILPWVPELRQNLRHLHEKLHFVSFPPSSAAASLGLLLSSNAWIVVASVGGWLILIGLGLVVAIRSPIVRAWSTGATVAGVLALVASIAGFLIRPTGAERVANVLVITTPQSKAYTAAATTSGTVMDQLPPGSQIRLLEKRGAWSYVEIPGSPENVRGWVESDAATPLWPWPAALIP